MSTQQRNNPCRWHPLPDTDQWLVRTTLTNGTYRDTIIDAYVVATTFRPDIETALVARYETELAATR